MATYTATFPGYANGRASRYAGWADVEISPGAVITVTADDGATVTIGSQALTVASPDPSGGSGYQPGTGTLWYFGGGGRMIVTFTAWSAGGPGFVTIDGFDKVYGGGWEQVYLQPVGEDPTTEDDITVSIYCRDFYKKGGEAEILYFNSNHTKEGQRATHGESSVEWLKRTGVNWIQCAENEDDEPRTTTLTDILEQKVTPESEEWKVVSKRICVVRQHKDPPRRWEVWRTSPATWTVSGPGVEFYADASGLTEEQRLHLLGMLTPNPAEMSEGDRKWWNDMFNQEGTSVVVFPEKTPPASEGAITASYTADADILWIKARNALNEITDSELVTVPCKHFAVAKGPDVPDSMPTNPIPIILCNWVPYVQGIPTYNIDNPESPYPYVGGAGILWADDVTLELMTNIPGEDNGHGSPQPCTGTNRCWICSFWDFVWEFNDPDGGVHSAGTMHSYSRVYTKGVGGHVDYVPTYGKPSRTIFIQKGPLGVPEYGGVPWIKVAPEVLEISCAGGTQYVSVAHGAPAVDIGVSTSADWLSADNTGAITAQPNEAEEVRTATVTFTLTDGVAVDVICTQAAYTPPPSVEVSPSEVMVSAKGGTLDVSVSANSSAGRVQTLESDSWITSSADGEIAVSPWRGNTLREGKVLFYGENGGEAILTVKQFRSLVALSVKGGRLFHGENEVRIF